MPELPEVETVVTHIRPQLVGKRIAHASLPPHYKRALHGSSLQSFNRTVKGQAITQVTRRAKFIVLELEDGSAITIHLRMTGRILFGQLAPNDKKYVTFHHHFTDNHMLHFKDVRKFGRIELLTSSKDLDSRVGIEPLGSDFTYTNVSQILVNRTRAIKSFLLDQKYIAGLGNIYVDEASGKQKFILSAKLTNSPQGKSKISARPSLISFSGVSPLMGLPFKAFITAKKQAASL